MKLAFTIFKYFPYGGIQRDMLKIAREMIARGHSVTVFTLRWQAELPDDLDVCVFPPEGIYRHAQYEHFALQVLERTRDGAFDLVVGFNKMPGLDVYYAGDSCYLEKANTQREGWYRLLPRFKSFVAAERAVFDEASPTRILTISDYEIPRYRHYYRTPAERFYALPPGIEEDRIAPPDKDDIRRRVRAAQNVADDELMILFVGSGFKKKGLDRALLAFAALPAPLRDRVRLFVIGRDKAEGFERMALRLGINDRVTFYAEGRDDVPEFMFAADALLHPAYDETAGMVIVEAILAGLPALVTRNCGYAKHLARHEAGIVLPLPFSQEALNQALERLLTSAEREVWIRNGLAAVEKEDFFGLVPRAADHLEQFAGERRPVLVFCLFRYFAFGGLQRDFMRIARACLEDGFDIVVYCLEWHGETPPGFRVVVVPVERLVNHARYARFAEYVAEDARWRRPAAIVGFNKMPGLDLYYAADPCFEHKAQAMRTAMYRTTRRYKQLAAFERAVFDKDVPTKIMLITRAQQETFQRYYDTPDSRLCVLPPGVSVDRRRGAEWQTQRSALRAEFGVADDEHLVVQIGSGFITKGLDRTLIALARLPDAVGAQTRLLVIGQDNPQSFLRQAKGLGIEDRLTIVSGRDDVPAVLQAADLMVHPAYMESGGLVLIESVIAGLPVIATEVCGFAHYIKEADAGVVLPEPFDQSNLDRAVADALTDEAQRAVWSRNGIDFGVRREDLYDMPAHALRFIRSSLPKVAA